MIDRKELRRLCAPIADMPNKSRVIEQFDREQKALEALPALLDELDAMSLNWRPGGGTIGALPPPEHHMILAVYAEGMSEYRWVTIPSRMGAWWKRTLWWTTVTEILATLPDAKP